LGSDRFWGAHQSRRGPSARRKKWKNSPFLSKGGKRMVPGRGVIKGKQTKGKKRRGQPAAIFGTGREKKKACRGFLGVGGKFESRRNGKGDERSGTTWKKRSPPYL